jgi:hypothetical protein
MLRSVAAAIVKSTDEVLFNGVGSVTVAGGVTVAAFVTIPAAVDAATVPLIVYVTVAPTFRFAVVEIVFPPPDAAPHAAPADATHVHVTPVSEAGTESVIVAPVTFDGPAFVTTTVYATAAPGKALGTLTVLVTPRSARGVTSSVSVAELFPLLTSVVPAGAVTEAVLINVAVPAAVDGFNVPVIV